MPQTCIHRQLASQCYHSTIIILLPEMPQHCLDEWGLINKVFLHHTTTGVVHPLQTTNKGWVDMIVSAFTNL